MRTANLLLACGLAAAFTATPAAAQRKDCEELKGEIEAKLKAEGVQKYTVEVVAPDAVGERKVVGSCDGGTKRIVYVRG